MKGEAKKFFLLWLIFTFVFLGLLVKSLQMNDGKLIYALDDAYIHMAVAKNTVRYGVFGATRYSFSTPTSSPLWTLSIIGLFYLFGVRDFIPLILNYLLGLILLLYFFSRVSRYINATYAFLYSLLFALLLPLFPLIFSGMEHLLHVLLILMVFERFYIFLEEEKNRDFRILLFLLFLATTVRLETIFLAGAIFFVLLIRRKFFKAFLPLIFSGLGIVVPGIFFLLNSWPLLPASVLAKGDSRLWIILKNSGLWDAFLFFINALRVKNFKYFEVMMLLVALGILISFVKKRNLFVLYSAYFLTFLAHSTFAQFGWFFRYEAYLVAMGLFLAVVVLPQLKLNLEKRFFPIFSIVAIMFLLFIAFVERIASNYDVPLATHNIYTQQYQMAQFIKIFYQGQAIIANDIGAINYYADIKCIDSMGLSNLTVQKMWRRLKNTLLDNLSKMYPVQIAVVYEAIFKDMIPPYWKKAGEWEIRGNIVCGSDRVSFFTVRDETLSEKLRIYSTFLPDVIERGYNVVKKPIFLEKLILIEAEESPDMNFFVLPPGAVKKFSLDLKEGFYRFYVKARPGQLLKEAAFSIELSSSLQNLSWTFPFAFKYWHPYNCKFRLRRAEKVSILIKNTSPTPMLIDKILILKE